MQRAISSSHSHWLFAAVLSTLLFLAACNTSVTTTGTGSGGSVSKTSTPSNNVPISQTYASCKLATVAEMSATTGLSVTQATQAANICLYDIGDANHEITAAVSPYSDTARAQQVISDICTLGQPIPGLGDKACTVPNLGADVLRGHYLLAISIGDNLGISDKAGLATKIAQLMTPRLQ